jgi:hypothetical protein
MTIGDQLLTHSEYGKYLLGAIVGSGYPMSGKARTWGVTDRPERDSLHGFAYHTVQAYYNAVLFHLGKESALLDYAVPKSLEKALDGEQEADLPGVWINQIGARDFYPVQFTATPLLLPDPSLILRRRGQVRNAPAKDVEAVPHRHPRTRLFYCVMIALVFVTVVLQWNFWKAWRHDVFGPSAARLAAENGQDANPQDDDSGTRTPIAEGPLGLRRMFSSRAMVALDAKGRHGRLPATWVAGELYLVARSGAFGILAALCLYLNQCSCVGHDCWPSDALVTAVFPLLAAANVGALLASVLDVTLIIKRPPKIEPLASLSLMILIFPLFPGVWLKCAARMAAPDALLRGARLAELSSGVSSAVPVLCLAVIGLWWFYWRLVQMRLFCADHRAGALVRQLLGLADRWHPRAKADGERDVQLRLFVPRFWLRVAVLAPLLGVVYTEIHHWMLPSPDGRASDTVIFFGLLLSSLMIAFELLHLPYFWTNLESVHKRLAKLPMLRAFDRLPQEFTDRYGDLVFPERAHETPTTFEAQQFRRISELPYPFVQHLAAAPARRMCLWDKWNRGEIRNRRNIDVLTEAVGNILAATRWRERSAVQAFGKADGGSASRGSTAGTATADAESTRWLHDAEDFMAIAITVALSRYRLLIKHQALFLLAAPILLLCAVLSYPLQPQGLLATCAGTLIFLSLCVLVFVLTRMNRDDLLSRINKTKSSLFTLDWTFIHPLALWSLPLLAVLLSRLPVVGDFIGSFLESVLHSLPLH